MSIRKFLEDPVVQPERWATGFPTLDALRGGFARGELWVITGAPSTGKSVLLTQFAYSLAVDHDFSVEYHASRRDPPALTRARFLSLAVRRAPSLPDLEVSLDAVSHHSQTALEALKSSQLDVFLGGGLRIPPWDDADVRQRCLVVDDADGSRAPVPTRSATSSLRGVADRGALVLLAVPRSHCFNSDASESLREEWSAVADVIIYISANEAGFLTFHLRQNRSGPERDIPVSARWHFARFDEMPAT